MFDGAQATALDWSSGVSAAAAKLRPSGVSCRVSRVAAPSTLLFQFRKRAPFGAMNGEGSMDPPPGTWQTSGAALLSTN